MPRGRRAQPDEVKDIKGNPGKRRLATLQGAARGEPRQKITKAEPPEFLKNDAEKLIFAKIVNEYLQRRIARQSDLVAYGRYAVYVTRWIHCKDFLEGKATFFKTESLHGPMLRRHPMFKDMLDLERVLQSLEDRLGLNPVARQNLMRGLANMPAAMGELFGDDADRDGKKEPDDAMPAAQTIAELENPIGLLQRAATSPDKLN